MTTLRKINAEIGAEGANSRRFRVVVDAPDCDFHEMPLLRGFREIASQKMAAEVRITTESRGL